VLSALEADGARPRAVGALAESLGAERREVRRALGELVAAEAVVRVGREIAYPAAAYARLREEVSGLCRREGSTSIAEVRDELGLSRKYAQALLEHLDAERVLRRDGDRHFPREVPQRA
jgi:selenocysteine-specific elongation factor